MHLHITVHLLRTKCVVLRKASTTPPIKAAQFTPAAERRRWYLFARRSIYIYMYAQIMNTYALTHHFIAYHYKYNIRIII